MPPCQSVGGGRYVVGICKGASPEAEDKSSESNSEACPPRMGAWLPPFEGKHRIVGCTPRRF